MAIANYYETNHPRSYKRSRTNHIVLLIFFNIPLAVFVTISAISFNLYGNLLEVNKIIALNCYLIAECSSICQWFCFGGIFSALSQYIHIYTWYIDSSTYQSSKMRFQNIMATTQNGIVYMRIQVQETHPSCTTISLNIIISECVCV